MPAIRPDTLRTRRVDVTAYAKPLLYVAGLTPAAWTFYLAVNDRLGANPLDVLERSLGLWSLRFLVIGLAITPLRRFTGVNLIRYRRAIGLLAFFYALLHVITYAGIDHGLDIATIVKDIWKRPFITVGMAAFLILIPLAATSNAASIRWLKSAWSRLHKWVYAAAALAALHYIMLVKTWNAEPLIYAVLILSLLAVRLVPRARPADRSAAAAAS
jgi:methionine sulfoxide reductase heme-binding subunit